MPEIRKGPAGVEDTLRRALSEPEPSPQPPDVSSSASALTPEQS